MIFSLPQVRTLVGEQASAVLIAAVALTLALTPTLAEAGRALAGRLRRRPPQSDPELQPHETEGPVFIAGMGRTGRTLADALAEFDIGYAAVERDERRLRNAVADGYNVAYGDFSDPRLWDTVALHGRQVTVVTAPSFEVATELTPTLAPALSKPEARRRRGGRGGGSAFPRARLLAGGGPKRAAGIGPGGGCAG